MGPDELDHVRVRLGRIKFHFGVININFNVRVKLGIKFEFHFRVTLGSRFEFQYSLSLGVKYRCNVNLGAKY